VTSPYNSSRYYRDQDRWTLARGSITFDGTAGKGAQGTVTLFDVTGVVELSGYPVGTCTVSLVGAADIEIGAGDGSDEFGSFADATSIDAGMLFLSTNFGTGTRPTATRQVPVNGDIIITIGTADITAGVLYFFVWWRPLSADGAVVLGPNMVKI